MPLLPGKKNIGKNIKTEEAHGKSAKVAKAIALNKAYGPKKKTTKRKSKVKRSK